MLALTTGARRVAPLAGALTFGMRGDASERLRALVSELSTGPGASIAFALP